MDQITYTVVSPEMVWLEYTKNGDKHVKELLGKEASEFLKFISDVEPNDKAVLGSSGTGGNILPEKAMGLLKGGSDRKDSQRN